MKANAFLMKQMVQIKGLTNEDAMARQLLWAKHHNARNQFLEQLNEALDKDGLERGTKQRAKIYSSSVAEYDKDHRLDGWK